MSKLLRCKVERVLEAVSGFTNSSSLEDNELYLLSFRVAAMPDIAKNVIEVNDIGRKAVADFIDSLLVENLSFTTHKMLQAKKLLRLATSRRNCTIYKTSSAR